MAERHYFSIGEVLSVLREEFPDVTISKIRFLESQGLLDPERTPSGYRKFYEDDVERLRWILRQQREHFLPLKVIKGRLGVTPGDNGGADGGASGAAAARALDSRVGEAGGRRAVRHLERVDEGEPDPLVPAASGASLTLAELAQASGLHLDELRELERFGLLSGRPMAGTVYYEAEAAAVASLAAGFLKFGVEARHLRMYRNAAEREASFFEQVVMPLIKQRNPDARRQALETLSHLARLGQSLRAAMLRQALSDHLQGG